MRRATPPVAQRLVVWLAYELASHTAKSYELRAATWRPQGGKGRQRGVCTGGSASLLVASWSFRRLERRGKMMDAGSRWPHG